MKKSSKSVPGPIRECMCRINAEGFLLPMGWRFANLLAWTVPGVASYFTACFAATYGSSPLDCSIFLMTTSVQAEGMSLIRYVAHT